MAELTLYSFEDAEGNEDTYTTMDPNEAREFARENRLKMIAQTYEYSDSVVVEDFTGVEGDDDGTDEHEED
jgi:hypothetical protein